MNTQDHKQALPPGFRLGSYCVVRVLGAGGFRVTYLCERGGLGVAVAVQGYLPNDIAVRSGNAVAPKSAADREGYQWGLSRFLYFGPRTFVDDVGGQSMIANVLLAILDV